MKNKRVTSKRSMACEQLEQRWTPAQFGIPWPDSTHLTLSFVPDATRIESESSQLHAAMDAKMPRATWQKAILDAVQAWASVANVNIGLVTDGGQPLGVAGATQSDPRFGDIRIAGLPMGNDALAVSVPPSNTTSGTYAGDIIINTRAQFTASRLYAAMLHEVGHALGLDHSTDAASPMFPTVREPAALNSTAIAQIRSLYGARNIDPNEGPNGNNSVKKATRIDFSAVSSGFTGATPVVAYSDIGTPTDFDYLELRSLPGYTGPITFRVQTAGISLLTPRIALFDEAGRVLRTAVATNTNGSVLTLQIPSSSADGKYFLLVQAAPNSVYKVGRYAVAVTFDGRLGPLGISIDQVLRGRYESLQPEKVDELFARPATAIFEDDLHANDTALTATTLEAGPGQPSERHLGTVASISDLTDVDFYQVRAPHATTTNANWVMTITLRGVGAKALVPRLQVYDSNLVAVAAPVVVNGNGTFVVELPSVPARSTYFLRLSAPLRTGNYSLDINFGTVATQLENLPSGSLTAARGFSASYDFYVARSQLFSFLLGSVGAPVKMTIRDLSGQIVYQLTATPGLPVSAISKLLTPGRYRVTFESTAAARFQLRGTRITDPIGVVYNSPTFTPQYQPNPTIPSYVFPFAPTVPIPVPYAFNPIP